MSERITDGPNLATEHFAVAIVGAGQAGLAASYLLTERGVRHVLLERRTPAHEWQTGRWDSFTLVTPNWQCRMPGFPYSGRDPDGFMTRAEVAAYLAEYVTHFDPPVRCGVRVAAVQQAAAGGFLIESTGREDQADVITADQVIVATGGYHEPRIPLLAERLPTDLLQLHSSQYRSPQALPPGAVLVVGTGQSGAQIAEDLHLDGRDVHLVTGSAPRVARRYRGRDCVAWLEEMGHYDIPVESLAGGLSKREQANQYVTGRAGGHDIDLRQFAREGMRLYGRLVGVAGSQLTFAPTLAASLDRADAVAESIKDTIDAYLTRAGLDAPPEDRYRPVWRPDHEPVAVDLADAGITSVVWATGYLSNYRWLRVPVFDGAGMPCHHRGVTGVPGLYFLGLPWLHTWGSGRFASVGRDARHVVEELELRSLPEASLR